jgi:hypothetical protein
MTTHLSYTDDVWLRDEELAELANTFDRIFFTHRSSANAQRTVFFADYYETD